MKPPVCTLLYSWAASDGYKRQGYAVATENFGSKVYTWAQWEKTKKAQGEEAANAEQKAALAGGAVLVKDSIADIALQQVLTRPEDFDVIATLNLNGDYLSDALAAQVVQHATRRAHHHVRAMLQACELGANGCTTAQDQNLEIAFALGQPADLARHLLGKLACRAQPQCLRSAELRLPLPQQRPAARRRLAAAGLGLRHHTAALHPSGQTPSPTRWVPGSANTHQQS